MKSTPIALTIAGSDCSAGAGLQADLKTFSAHQVYGLTVVTCVVSETPQIVSKIHALPPEMVADQLNLLLATYPVTAIKTGMLYSAAQIDAVVAVLKKFSPFKLVIDPVMISSSGVALIDDTATAAYREKLFPLATVITPNLHEAEFLLGKKTSPQDNFIEYAKILSEKFSCAVLLKGGHSSNDFCDDILYAQNEAHIFSHPRIDTQASHGTGCTLSAAITAQLSMGKNLVTACVEAKRFINEALTQSYDWQGKSGAIYALNQSVKLSR